MKINVNWSKIELKQNDSNILMQNKPQRSIYGLYIKSAPFFGDLNFFQG